jgi:hypothetical protein
MYLKKIQITAMLFWTIIFGFAQNPICPAGVYIPDPVARVWNDGKVYVYGSLIKPWDDELNAFKLKGDCYQWGMSSSDLINWEITKDIFASVGPNDQVSYNDAPLWAPDCMFRNGTYYLYYCQPTPKMPEGVATSKSPLGPFTNAKPIYLKGYNQIDPAVFIDDDGQAYYLWGQFEAKIARLKPNMTEIDTTSINPCVVTEKEHFFHEGVNMIKRNGLYYLVYTDISRKGRATCIEYSTSKYPMGPYKYRGVIIDNDGCDLKTWNDHGSLVEFKNKWYVFYHRATNGSVSLRKACIEPISFNEDGSITEVEMTSQGAGKPLDAFSKIEAERACLMFGSARIESVDKDSDQLGFITNDNNAEYKYIDFGTGAKSIQIRVASGKSAGKIAFKLDRLWHGPLGTIDIPGNGDGKTWTTLTCKLDETAGIHSFIMVFSTDDNENESFNVDWFKFEK